MESPPQTGRVGVGAGSGSERPLPSSAVFGAPRPPSTGTPQLLRRPPCLRLWCLGVNFLPLLRSLLLDWLLDLRASCSAGGDSRCVSSFWGFFPSLGQCPCTDQGLGESLGALCPAHRKLRVAPGSAQVPCMSPPQAGSWAVAGSPPLPPRPQWSPSFAACCLVSFVHF